MRRRELIAGLAGATVTWPLRTKAQQVAIPVVGFFSAGSPTIRPWPEIMTAFSQGLEESGFVEGRNVAIEYRWAEDHYDRLPTLAAELVRRSVAVIAATPRAVLAAKAQTSTIPIVFLSGNDPVRVGLVASLSRPGGNLTGVTNFTGDLNGKRFGLFHEIVPQAEVIGVLSDRTNPFAGSALQEVQAAARSLGVPIKVVSVGTNEEIETAFASFAKDGVAAVFLNNSFLFSSTGESEHIAALGLRRQISLSGEGRTLAELGGLMSYGTNDAERYRQMGRYAGRILRGERPADLPVVLPTKFEFVINLKTAKALGLTIPETLLATADEVIQ
jgi:putative ABC transport system substrate-binding protein